MLLRTKGNEMEGFMNEHKISCIICILVYQLILNQFHHHSSKRNTDDYLYGNNLTCLREPNKSSFKFPLGG